MPAPGEDIIGHPVVRRLRGGEIGSVVVLAGAGISVNAGIPDFRSPGTGLYANLERYRLPEPEDVFTLSYFRKDPWPFTLLAKELWPSRFRPTPTHLFVRLLEKKGVLLRHYTQNIDGLEATAGILKKHLVEAHGSFSSGHCIDCRRSFDKEFLWKHILGGQVARCSCGGLVKPDIVFFGEELPDRFFTCSKQDFRRCDLVLCMGTSLAVEPFAGLAARAESHVPRLLINRELPEDFKQRRTDLLLLGDCDEQVWQLAEALGWTDELGELVAEHEPQSALASRWHQGILMALGLAFLTSAYVQHPDGIGSVAGAGVLLWFVLVLAIALGLGRGTSKATSGPLLRVPARDQPQLAASCLSSGAAPGTQSRCMRERARRAK